MHEVTPQRFYSLAGRDALRAEVHELMRTFRPEAAEVFARNRRLAESMLESDRRTWAHDIGMHRYISQ